MPRGVSIPIYCLRKMSLGVSECRQQFSSVYPTSPEQYLRRKTEGNKCPECFPFEHHADSLACRFYDLPQNCSGCQSLEFVPSAPDLCNVRASLPLPFFLLLLPLFAKVINPNFGSAGSHKNWSGGKGSSCDQIGADFEICNE